MRNLQNGFTLTGLMISIVLVQVVVLVSLKLQSAHHSTIENIRVSSAHNRVLTTALTVAIKELKGAGYGIPDADSSHTFIKITAPTATDPYQIALLWRLQEGVTPVCRGLKESGITIDNIDYRQLELISSPGMCDLTSDINTLPWDGIEATLGTWEIDDLLLAHLNDNGSLFSFQLNNGTCSVARLTNDEPRRIATISAPNTAELNGHVIPSNVRDVCLVNVGT